MTLSILRLPFLEIFACSYKYRSSPSQKFYKKGVLKNFIKKSQAVTPDMVFTDEFKNSYRRIGTNQFFNAWTKWNRESHSFRKYLLQTKKNLQLYSIQKYFTRARPNSCFKRWKSTRNPWSFFLIMFRSSHGRCSLGKVALKDFAKFTGKHLFQGLLFF